MGERAGGQAKILAISAGIGALYDGVVVTLHAMAEQINRCKGPSGSNRDYVLHLAQALRGMGVTDEHVFEVESWVLQG